MFRECLRYEDMLASYLWTSVFDFGPSPLAGAMLLLPMTAHQAPVFL